MFKWITLAVFAVVATAGLAFGNSHVGVAEAASQGVGCPASWPAALNIDGRGADGYQHTDNNGVDWVLFGRYPIYRAYLATNAYEVGYFPEPVERTCMWNIAKGELVIISGGAKKSFVYAKADEYGPPCPSSWPGALNKEGKSVDALPYTDDSGAGWALFGAYPIYRAYKVSLEHEIGYINESTGDTCFWNLQRNKQVIMQGGNGHNHVVVKSYGNGGGTSAVNNAPQAQTQPETQTIQPEVRIIPVQQKQPVRKHQVGQAAQTRTNQPPLTPLTQRTYYNGVPIVQTRFGLRNLDPTVKKAYIPMAGTERCFYIALRSETEDGKGWHSPRGDSPTNFCVPSELEGRRMEAISKANDYIINDNTISNLMRNEGKTPGCRVTSYKCRELANRYLAEEDQYSIPTPPKEGWKY